MLSDKCIKIGKYKLYPYKNNSIWIEEKGGEGGELEENFDKFREGLKLFAGHLKQVKGKGSPKGKQMPKEMPMKGKGMMPKKGSCH